MSFAEYDRHDALGLAALIAKKKITAREAIDEAIARAEKLNPALNAIIFPAFERARDAAKSRLPRGPFTGVPILLKDMRAGAIGMPTRSGSRMMPPIPADHDSTVVARFRAAGLIPLGKTNVPEFGILPTTESALYGPARNPWNLAHSTGGSSGGSAAAVAAGIVPIAHATDGGGSIRIPASCNGLVGLKVSRGRITQGPDASDSTSGLSVDNVVTRSVRDTAAALDFISAIDYGDPYTAPAPEGSYLDGIRRKPKRLRIAFSLANLYGRGFHPDVTAAVKKAAKLCGELGHTVEEATPAIPAEESTEAFMTLWACATGYGVSMLAGLTGIAPSLEVLEGLTLGLYERGRQIPAIRQIWAQQTLFRYARVMAAFHERYDVWLTPTLGAPPVALGVIDTGESDVERAFEPFRDYVPYTALQNGSGQPAINLPLHWNKDGLPIGVQFVARYGGETLLLKLAAELEKASPWAQRRPNVNPAA